MTAAIFPLAYCLREWQCDDVVRGDSQMYDDDEMIDELWRRAVPYLLFGCGMIAGMVICGSLISWGWM